MLERILTGQQEVLLAEERTVLRALAAALVRCEAGDEDLEALDQSIGQLDELFLLVVAGEFNSGKSTFINALLGRPLLEEGVTPTTSRIHRLTWGEREHRGAGPAGVLELEAPVEILRHVQIVDTPGTNALERRHEAITERFIPRSDLVLFVTSADRPFTESERAFIEKIREWGKKLVFVVNKVDFLPAEEDREKVRAFIEDNARKLLGFSPEIFMVSARQALAARLEENDRKMAASRLPALERYLVETLDAKERVRLKLSNPLGVGDRLAARYLEALDARVELLKDDFRALERIDGQLDLYEEDMAREFRLRLTDVDHELHRFEERGREFFDDTLRLARAFDLFNKERLQADFERKVVADTPERLETKVDEIIDWLVESELRQWQEASELLESRRGRHAEEVPGGIGRFDLHRGELLESVGRTARRTLASYDQRVEARRMAESVQTAVAGTALIEAGAIGLGAVFTLLATSQLADVTGILAAGTIAILGLFVLPAKRKRAKCDFAAKILALREKLMTGLTEQFGREVERSAGRIREAVAPYTRFVRAERERLASTRTDLATARDNLERIRQMIEGL